MKISKQYTQDSFKMFIDNNELVIGKEPNFEAVEVPVEFINNPETRKAIFDAYINLGDTYPETIYKVIREAASEATIHWASDLVGNDFWN